VRGLPVKPLRRLAHAQLRACPRPLPDPLRLAMVPAAAQAPAPGKPGGSLRMVLREDCLRASRSTRPRRTRSRGRPCPATATSSSTTRPSGSGAWRPSSPNWPRSGRGRTTIETRVLSPERRQVARRAALHLEGREVTSTPCARPPTRPRSSGSTREKSGTPTWTRWRRPMPTRGCSASNGRSPRSWPCSPPATRR